MSDYFGKFHFSYEPPSSKPSGLLADEIPETVINMTISAGADLHEMLSFYRQFLLANGYLIDPKQELIIEDKES